MCLNHLSNARAITRISKCSKAVKFWTLTSRQTFKLLVWRLNRRSGMLQINSLSKQTEKLLRSLSHLMRKDRLMKSMMTEKLRRALDEFDCILEVPLMISGKAELVISGNKNMHTQKERLLYKIKNW